MGGFHPDGSRGKEVRPETEEEAMYTTYEFVLWTILSIAITLHAVASELSSMTKKLYNAVQRRESASVVRQLCRIPDLDVDRPDKDGNTPLLKENR